MYMNMQLLQRNCVSTAIMSVFTTNTHTYTDYSHTNSPIYTAILTHLKQYPFSHDHSTKSTFYIHVPSVCVPSDDALNLSVRGRVLPVPRVERSVHALHTER